MSARFIKFKRDTGGAEFVSVNKFAITHFESYSGYIMIFFMGGNTVTVYDTVDEVNAKLNTED